MTKVLEIENVIKYYGNGSVVPKSWTESFFRWTERNSRPSWNVRLR